MTAVDMTAEPGLPPLAPGLPLVGSALHLRKQGLLSLLQSSHRSLGDVFRLRVGRKDSYIVANPEGAAHILVENAKNYAKSRSYQRLKVLLGNGLLITEGDMWRRQRSISQPFFHKQRINGLADAVKQLADARLTKWETALARGQEVDIKEQCKVLSLELVAHSIFGVDAGENGLELGRVTDQMSDYVERRRLRLVPLPEGVPTPSRMMARYKRWCVDRVAKRVMANGAGHGTEGGLLSMLLEATTETGELAFTEDDVLDQVVTILVAGYETTASALTWTTFLMARHPAVAEQLRAEVDRVVGQRLPTLEDLNNLTYLGMVLSESMRLYPPAWVIGRRSLQADTIGGFTIPAGSSVGVYPYLIHRSPDFWRDPEVFDPENFAPAAVERRPRFAYFPFGGGARLCIGDRLAQLELKTCLAMIIQRFQMTTEADFVPKIRPQITLSPPAGMPLRLQRRHR